MATHVPPPGGAAPQRKTSPWLWVLVGCFGLIVLAGILAVATGLFVVHKVKQAGLDPELMKSNPALAMTKMITAFNPDLEVLSVDEDRGIITVKDKKTGKTVTLNFEDVKQGKILIAEEGKEAVSIQTSKEGGGSVEVRSGEGTVKLGAGGKLPEWIPEYPGVKIEATYSVQGKEGWTGSFHFETGDAADKVVRFYENGLKKAGLKVTVQGGIITGEDSAARRKAFVNVTRADGRTAVMVSFEER